MATWADIHEDALNDLAVLSEGEIIDPAVQRRDLRICRSIVVNTMYRGIGISGYYRINVELPSPLPDGTDGTRWRLRASDDPASAADEIPIIVMQAPVRIRAIRFSNGETVAPSGFGDFYDVEPTSRGRGQRQAEFGGPGARRGDGTFYYEKQIKRPGLPLSQEAPGGGLLLFDSPPDGNFTIFLNAPDYLVPEVLAPGNETGLPDHERYIALRLAVELAPSYSATDMLVQTRRNLRDAMRALYAATRGPYPRERVEREFRQETRMMGRGRFLRVDADIRLR